MLHIKNLVDLSQNLIQKNILNIKSYVLEDYEKILEKKYGKTYLVPNKGLDFYIFYYYIIYEYNNEVYFN